MAERRRHATSAPPAKGSPLFELGEDEIGLGGTPISELYILFWHAHERLTELGITVGRSSVGEHRTSLDLAGASLTLVRLDDEIEGLLEEPAEIAARIF